MRTLCLALVAGLLTSGPVLVAAPPVAIEGVANVRAIGEVVMAESVLTAKGAKTVLVIGADDADTFRTTAEVKPADKANHIFVQVIPTDVSDVSKRAVLYAGIYRDATGLQFKSETSEWDTANGQWGSNNDPAWLTYWPLPTDTANLALVEGSGIAPRTLKNHWFNLRIEAGRRHVRFWLDGLLVREVERPSGTKGPVVLVLAEGDQMRNATLAPFAESSIYLPVDLTLFAHDRPTVPMGKDGLALGGVPFELAAGGQGFVDLRTAQWIEQKQDPLDTYEHYDGGPPVLHDPRMTLLRVPPTDYVAAHVLAIADDDPQTTPNFTLRAGRYGHSDQVVQHSFPGTAPRKAAAAKAPAGERLDTPIGPFVQDDRQFEYILGPDR
jgi:hypothetical protein